MMDEIPDNGCRDPRCTRMNGKCVGYHCSKCGGPCSSQGHMTKDSESGEWYFYCQEERP